MVEPTLFEHACVAAGWGKPADFLRAFDEAAELLGEAVTLTDRQARRWRGPCPPMPRARAWRVLHAMFACDPRDLGFPGHRRVRLWEVHLSSHRKAWGV